MIPIDDRLWVFTWQHLWCSIGLLHATFCDDDEIDPSLTAEG